MSAVTLTNATSKRQGPVPSDTVPGKAPTGVPGLDALTGGGFPAQRTVLVRGPVGSGKTTLALQFLLEGVRRGEPGVFVSVDAKPRHVLADAAGIGLDPQPAVDAKALVLLDASPYFTEARRNGPLDARQVASDLTSRARGAGAKRVVVDSLSSLLPPGESAERDARDFLRSLFFSLEDNLGATVLLTAWDRDDDSPALIDAEYLASAVLELRLPREGDRLLRRLLVRKIRGGAIDLREREVQIAAPRGLVVQG